MTHNLGKNTFFHVLGFTFLIQRIVGLNSFIVQDGRLVITKISKTLQFIPLILYSILVILIYFHHHDILVKLTSLDSFINIQFSFVTLTALITNYAILLTSIKINRSQVEFYNRILDIDKRLKSELDIEIDYIKFGKYITRASFPLSIYMIFNTIMPYFLANSELTLVYTILYVMPEGIAITENIYFVLIIKLVYDRFSVLKEHFQDGVTNKNVVNRFTIVNDIYFELCDLIRFLSDTYGFRLLFNLGKDFVTLVSLFYVSYWEFSDTRSFMLITPILLLTIPYWSKIVAVAGVCQFTTALVR